MNKNIIRHDFTVARSTKEKETGTKGCVLWLTGLSGSGKSTIANELERILFSQNLTTKVLDGDAVRHGLCAGLSFSQEDRSENLRRVAETAKLFAENATITICCFIAPLKSQRTMIKEIIGKDFKLIYINTDLDECEKRDPKGLYKEARAGRIKNFTGIGSTYEIPENSDLTLVTTNKSIEQCAKEVVDYYQVLICK